MRTKNKVNFRLRPFRASDAEGMNRIRTMRGVMETIPTLISESPEFTEKVCAGFGANDQKLCAVLDTEKGEKLIGFAALHLTEKPRVRHTASVSIIIDAEYQNMGLGRALLSALLELADKWLMLVRVELEVQAQNEKAIHLYESLGFVKEGLLKYAFMQDGRYTDIVVMGRYSLPDRSQAEEAH